MLARCPRRAATSSTSRKAGKRSTRLIERARTGGAQRERRIPGVFSIPAVAYDCSPSGISANGRRLILISPRTRFPRRRTTFAVVDPTQAERAPTHSPEGRLQLRRDLARRPLDVPDQVRLAEPRRSTRFAPTTCMRRTSSRIRSWIRTSHEPMTGVPVTRDREHSTAAGRTRSTTARSTRSSTRSTPRGGPRSASTWTTCRGPGARRSSCTVRGSTWWVRRAGFARRIDTRTHGSWSRAARAHRGRRHVMAAARRTHGGAAAAARGVRRMGRGANAPDRPWTIRWMMTRNLDFVGVPSQDRKRARGFYGETLGPRPRREHADDFSVGETCLGNPGSWDGPDGVRAAEEFAPSRRFMSMT